MIKEVTIDFVAYLLEKMANVYSNIMKVNFLYFLNYKPNIMLLEQGKL